MSIPSSVIRSFACRSIDIAYAHVAPTSKRTTICFIPGFRSEFRTSKKSVRVYEWAVQHGYGFMSWDHDEQVSVQQCFEDGRALLLSHCKSPIYFVGASMGLWLSLLWTVRVPLSVTGILGIGGAVDSTERWLREVPEAHRHDRTFVWQRPSLYDPSGYYTIPVHTLLDSRPALLMTQPSALHSVHVPVHLIHGAEDPDVPLSEAQKLVQMIPNATLDVVEHGDHRLSHPSTLDLVCQRLAENVT